MLKRIVTALVAVLLLMNITGCGSQTPLPKAEKGGESIALGEVALSSLKYDRCESISIAALLAHPEKYNGKRVGVYGFTRFDDEYRNLYFTEDDYCYENHQNAVKLGKMIMEDYDVSYEEKMNLYNGKSTIVEGTFKYDDKQGGIIDDITCFNNRFTRQDPMTAQNGSLSKEIGTPSDEAEKVDMFDVMADPSAYEDKRVRVEGVLYYKQHLNLYYYDMNALFFTQGDFEWENWKNSIQFDGAGYEIYTTDGRHRNLIGSLHGKKVCIEGIIKAENSRDLYACKLIGINYIALCE